VALGADRGSVLRLVVSQGAALAIVGIAFGTAAALVTTRVLSSLLYDVAPADPLTFVTVIALLAFSALAASFIPARRAAALQPSIALRD
jgi:ABC-type lipoprotein release transport system permease subunit